VRNKWGSTIGLVALVFVMITLFSSAFTIQEGRQAVITQFGKPLRTVTQAGLHWKAPFIHEVRHLDLRILNWDGYPNQIPTKDKKYILVDTTARWRIEDPLQFIQTVQNERGARTRLDAILDGITRDVISSHNLVEAVRNSNAVFERMKQMREANKAADAAGTPRGEKISGEIEAITLGREKLSAIIVDRAREELKPLGIALIDVQMRRIAYEASVQKKVYARMVSERQSIAQKIRSIGKGEQAKIRGRADKDLKKIESEAYRTIQKIKGEAEAEATRTYARSLGQDPQFYAFLRRLEAYEKALKSDTRLLFSTKSRFFDVLSGRGQ
jgi:membrane protease subunit HflC